MVVAKPTIDEVTELLVTSLLDLIAERKVAGKRELAATMKTMAEFLSERTGLAITERHMQVLMKTLSEAGLVTVGGGGIGLPNTYNTREKEMGPEVFWNQVDALLMVWQHPSRKAMR